MRPILKWLFIICNIIAFINLLLSGYSNLFSQKGIPVESAVDKIFSQPYWETITISDFKLEFVNSSYISSKTASEIKSLLQFYITEKNDSENRIKIRTLPDPNKKHNPSKLIFFISTPNSKKTLFSNFSPTIQTIRPSKIKPFFTEIISIFIHLFSAILLLFTQIKIRKNKENERFIDENEAYDSEVSKKKKTKKYNTTKQQNNKKEKKPKNDVDLENEKNIDKDKMLEADTDDTEQNHNALNSNIDLEEDSATYSARARKQDEDADKYQGTSHNTDNDISFKSKLDTAKDDDTTYKSEHNTDASTDLKFDEDFQFKTPEETGELEEQEVSKMDEGELIDEIFNKSDSVEAQQEEDLKTIEENNNNFDETLEAFPTKETGKPDSEIKPDQMPEDFEIELDKLGEDNGDSIDELFNLNETEDTTLEDTIEEVPGNNIELTDSINELNEQENIQASETIEELDFTKETIDETIKTREDKKEQTEENLDELTFNDADKINELFEKRFGAKEEEASSKDKENENDDFDIDALFATNSEKTTPAEEHIIAQKDEAPIDMEETFNELEQNEEFDSDDIDALFASNNAKKKEPDLATLDFEKEEFDSDDIDTLFASNKSIKKQDDDKSNPSQRKKQIEDESINTQKKKKQSESDNYEINKQTQKPENGRDNSQKRKTYTVDQSDANYQKRDINNTSETVLQQRERKNIMDSSESNSQESKKDLDLPDYDINSKDYQDVEEKKPEVKAIESINNDKNKTPSDFQKTEISDHKNSSKFSKIKTTDDVTTERFKAAKNNESQKQKKTFDRDKIEKDRWNEAVDKNTYQAYVNYLRRYPRGKFAQKATILQEQALFQEALDSNALKGFQQYLKQYPKGKFNKQAKLVIDEVNWKNASEIATYKSYIKYISESHFASRKSEAIDAVKKLVQGSWKAFQTTHKFSENGKYIGKNKKEYQWDVIYDNNKKLMTIVIKLEKGLYMLTIETLSGGTMQLYDQKQTKRLKYSKIGH